MEIYGLTARGKQLARSVRNPDSPEWRIIHFLDKTGRSTKEQIEEMCGMNSGQSTAVLRKLKYLKIVAQDQAVM